jgi:Glycosyltransferase sugar-binding region containing DXD motif
MMEVYYSLFTPKVENTWMPTIKTKSLGNGHLCIPPHIYQTWHTKTQLMPCMQQAIEKMKQQNPTLEHHLFDDQDCELFLQTEVEPLFPGVWKAYQCLIPGAYKADLWRYCILYCRGGIYVDIKFQPCHDFTFLELMDHEYFVLDRADLIGRPAIYNGCMIAMPRNPQLKCCIEKVIENVSTRNYGQCKLDITGPTMMASCFPYYLYHSLGYLRFTGNETDNYYIVTGEGKKILEFYREYRTEQRKSAKTGYYHELWLQRNVFQYP